MYACYEEKNMVIRKLGVSGFVWHFGNFRIMPAMPRNLNSKSKTKKNVRIYHTVSKFAHVALLPLTHYPLMQVVTLHTLIYYQYHLYHGQTIKHRPIKNDKCTIIPS